MPRPRKAPAKPRPAEGSAERSASPAKRPSAKSASPAKRAGLSNRPPPDRRSPEKRRASRAPASGAAGAERAIEPPLPAIPLDEPPWGAPPSTRSSDRTPGDRTREKIRDVALDVFAEHGFEGTSTREICARAGVNGAALNYHWRSKQALWEAVCEGCGEWFGRVAQSVDLSAHPRVAISQFLRAVFDGLAKDPRPIRVVGWAALLPHDDDREGVSRHFRPFVGFAYTYVRAQQSMGAIPASIDAEALALLVNNMLTYTVLNARGMRSVFGKDLRDPALAARFREAIVASALTLLGLAE